MSPTSWNAFAAPLDLEPRPTRALSTALWAGHLLALAALPLTGLGAAPALAAAGAVALSLRHCHRRHIAGTHPRSVRAARCDADGRWWLRTADARDGPAALSRPVYATPRLIVLRFRDEQRGRLTLLLPRGAVPETVHRRLRVRLRIWAASGMKNA